MTVSPNIPIFGPYAGDGINTQWDFDFRVDSPDHLFIILTDAEGVQTVVASNFSITGLGTNDGGTVTYPSIGDPVPAGTTVTGYRNVPYDQPNIIGQQGRFHPKTHEQTFDYLEMQIQQLAANINGLLVASLLGVRFVLEVYAGFVPNDDEVIFEFIVPYKLNLPEGVAGTIVAWTTFSAADDARYLILKNGVQVGTADFPAGSNLGSVTVPATVAFEPGNIFGLMANGAMPDDGWGYAFTFLFDKG